MSDTKVVTGLVRFSYANVWEAKLAPGAAEEKFSSAILIPKSDTATIAKINKAIEAAYAEFKEKNKGKLPPNFKLPLRDGDVEKEDDENYQGMYFLNASSKKQPGIVDKQTNPILDKSEFYSGVWGRASLNFYFFDVSGSKGVAVGLNHVQKIKDGEVLSGFTSAEEDFGDDFVDEDDDLMGG